MKNILFVLVLITTYQVAKSQCRPIFSVIDYQGPTIPTDFNLSEMFLPIDKNYYSISDRFDTVNYRISTLFSYWDGKNWNNLPIIDSSGSFVRLLKSNNKFYVQYPDNRYLIWKYGSHDYFYNIIQLKNGKWDTIPGTSQPYYRINDLYYYQANEQGLFSFTRNTDSDSLGQTFWKGSVMKFDTLLSKFVKVIDYETYYYDPQLWAGKNRMLLSGVSKVNGKPTNSFAIIDNGIITLNKDTSFKDRFLYLVDYSNDHIYAWDIWNPSLKKVNILEYSNKLVGNRLVNQIPFFNLGERGVSDGRILYQVSDKYGNSYTNILCSGELEWKTTIEPSFYYGSGQIYPTASGFYRQDYLKNKITKLVDGATVKGMVYVDLDSNCTYNKNRDTLLKNCLVTSTSKFYKNFTLSDSNGNYEFNLSQDTFLFSCEHLKSKCSNQVIISPITQTYNLNLPLKQPNGYDLTTSFEGGFWVRWNSETDYGVTIKNIGIPADSVSFEIKLDPGLKIINAAYPVNYFSGNIAKGVLKNLNYVDTREIELLVSIDSGNTKPGQKLYSEVNTTLHHGATDSTYSEGLNQLVVYSFDPNFKTCIYDTIAANKREYLEYNIEFQNEGNDDAHDVIVSDLIPNELDIETFKIIGTSHAYDMEINDRIITLKFKNIYLKPKKTDEHLSKGFIKYSIYTYDSLEDQTTISTLANIYFDLNSAVTTNNCYVSVVSNYSSIASVYLNKGNKFLLYPNPVSEVLNIKGDEPFTYQVYNLMGELVAENTLENQVTSIDVSSWSAGIYVVKCNNSLIKFIKSDY